MSERRALQARADFLAALTQGAFNAMALGSTADRGKNLAEFLNAPSQPEAVLKFHAAVHEHAHVLAALRQLRDKDLSRVEFVGG